MRPLNVKVRDSFIYEEFFLEHSSPTDYSQSLLRNMPCKGCKVMPAGQNPVLTLVASNEKEMMLLRNWVKLIDSPRESVTLTLYCVIVQEHQVDNFLSTLLYQSGSLVSNWKEGLTGLLLEMEREQGVTLLASPRVVIEVGSKTSLKMQDEFKLGGSSHGDTQQIDLLLVVDCQKQGKEKYRLDVDLVQKIFLKNTQVSSSPCQHNQLKTRITLNRDQLIFLGSAGQWSWISDMGSFSLMKILPQALVPFFHYDRGSKSQLIILAECR
jgi:hypothetical protein